MVATESQSQPSHLVIKLPTHQIHTLNRRCIGTPGGLSDSEQDSWNTALFFDFLDTAAALVLAFLHSS